MRRRNVLAAGVVTFAAAFAAARIGRASLARIAGHGHRVEAYTPTYRPQSGMQLAMIYFGSAHCAWASSPRLPRAVRTIETALATAARDRGWGFEAIGVALDWNPIEGIDHLRTVGAFDEVSSGENWGNSYATKYLGGLLHDPGATPEIVVMERRIQKADADSGRVNQRVDRKQLVLAKVGMVDIERWVANGVALPHLDSLRSE